MAVNDVQARWVADSASMRPRRIRRGWDPPPFLDVQEENRFNEAPANSPGMARRSKRLDSGTGRAGLRALAQSCSDCLRSAAGSGFLAVKERQWFNMLRHFERCPAFRVNRGARVVVGRCEATAARR